MTIKIFDTDCAINLFERMSSYDCAPFLSSYDVITTEEVFKELYIGNPQKNNFHRIHSLSSEEKELQSALSKYITKLGRGEVSVITHALHLSNVYDCEHTNKIVILCNDREAKHIFKNVICRDPALLKNFPYIHKIIWSQTVDFIRKLWDEGYINNDDADGIYADLYLIIGPKLNFLKR